MYKALADMSIDDVLAHIRFTIEENNLSVSDSDAYYKFREYYNKTRNPLDLFVLSCYSFNFQFRYNKRGEYNNVVGTGKSEFNSSICQRLVEFHKHLSDINFSSVDFRQFDFSLLSETDVVYADSPYLITTVAYNEARGTTGGWTKENEIDLYEVLDKLNKNNVKFVMFNVLEHKGNLNKCLNTWSKHYNVHELKDKRRKEVVITNF